MWGSKRKEKEEELKKQLEVMTLKLDLLKLSMKYGVAFFEEFKGEKEKVRIFELPKVKPNFRVELLGLFKFLEKYEGGDKMMGGAGGQADP